MNSSFHIASKIEFPRVFYGRLNVNGLSGDQIDKMLEMGWFRNSHQVYTTLGRYVEEEWKPTLMLRLPIQGFEFKKSLRKIMRRNEEQFSVKIQPFQSSDEMENLWQCYKREVHQWSKIPSISQHLFRGLTPEAFQTQMVSVYFENRLVAFSAFDRGNKSIASIEAAYDTQFSKHSLGIYTMLLEIDYCVQSNLSFYYPGFMPRDTPMFDYKLRPGNLEFFRIQSNEWVPFEKRKSNDWLFDEVIRELKSVQHLLFSSKLKFALRASCEVSIPSSEPKTSDFNFLLVVHQDDDIGRAILKIAYDALEKKYLVFRISNLSESKIGQEGNAQELSYVFEAEFDNKESLISECKQLLLNADLGIG